MSVSSSAAYIFLLMQTFQKREEKLCKDNFFFINFFFSCQCQQAISFLCSFIWQKVLI